MERAASERTDPRDVPSYDVVEAARYLRMPKSTLRAWFTGQDRFVPVLRAAATGPTTLSFFNLVEAHVLNAIRREHDVPLQRVRLALETAQALLPQSRHPLIDQRFETDGVDLFIRTYGELINLSRPGQEVMRDVLSEHLHRIAWSADRLPERLYPFSGTSLPDPRRSVVIDPRIGFGRRVIAGTGIATSVVAERYAAGETIDELADDYHRPRVEIEDAIRSEFDLAAA
jgi:uncharacterized protein (DUF433 family)